MDLLPPEIRSRYSVGGSFKISPLISDPELGPLRFSPIPESLSVLHSSPNLVPPSLLPPPQQLSLSRFLVTTSLVPLSTSTSIASLFGPSQYNDAESSSFANNRLQLLHCPSSSKVAIFFPAGTNSDQVGFVILDTTDSTTQLSEDGDVFRSNKRFNLPIVRILVNPIRNQRFSSAGEFIGYLMAYTMNSVHWFAVKRLSDTGDPLVYLCSKLFKSSAVAGACWSRKLPEFSAVLLENGNLFLFDLDLFLHKDNSSNHNIMGKRLKVQWSNSDMEVNSDIEVNNDMEVNSDMEVNNKINLEQKKKNNKIKWLGCEFGYDHKTIIAAHSCGAYLVDFHSDQCSVKSVEDTEGKSEPFIAFSKADSNSDGFHFALSSKTRLVLYDVRKLLRPVLQWVHNIHNPISIDVLRLSHLRSDPEFQWASESGTCIVLSSFWNCEFSLFCYGPSPIDSKQSELCKSVFAWGLPSELSLSSHDCRCGSCLVKQESSKDQLPEWIHWQQKKDIVLGFGILDRKLCPGDGFTVIRLMSSGKLESQSYSASGEHPKTLKTPDEQCSKQFRDYIMCPEFDEDYKFARRFKYFNFRYLDAFFKGNLNSILHHSKSNDTQEESSSTRDDEFHAILCENRRKLSSSSSFDEISLPTTITELALWKMWSKLPLEILQMAFSSYSESLEVLSNNKRVSLEFLVVPDSPQLPPFMLRPPSNRSNTWSNKVKRTEAMVGPVVPLPVLSALHKTDDTEEDNKFGLSSVCDEVMQEATALAMDGSSGFSQVDEENAVSLADDRDPWAGGSQSQKRRFLLHEPGSSGAQGGPKSATLVSKVSEKETGCGLEMFDDLCPTKMRFNKEMVDFGEEELRAYKGLKQLFLERQKDTSIAPYSNVYKDFLARCGLQS